MIQTISRRDHDERMDKMVSARRFGSFSGSESISFVKPVIREFSTTQICRKSGHGNTRYTLEIHSGRIPLLTKQKKTAGGPYPIPAAFFVYTSKTGSV